LADARAQGWLLGPFLEKKLWQPLAFETLTRVDWSAILAQTTNIAAIMGFSAPSVLLAAGGLELVTERHIELNRELKAAGIANIVSGFGGGMVGYHTVSDSTLAYRMGARSRLVGLSTAGLCAIVLIDGASFLSFFPKPVLGGLLLFLGLSFLADWIYDGWLKLSKADYILVLIILILIGTVGFLPGVGVGFLASMILFVFEYSRKSATRYVASGATRRSHIARSPQQDQRLSEKGDQIYILGLREFIFFGTANGQLDRIRRRLQDPQRLPLKFVVFDFQNVVGFDSSAVRSFIKIKQIAAENQVKLIFHSIEPAVSKRLEQGGCIKIDNPICQVFPNMDQSLEWCEEQILKYDHAEDLNLWT
jgi:SulP family sulfate permease